MKPLAIPLQSSELRVVVVSLAYFFIVGVGTSLAFKDIESVAIYPASGVGIALMFLYGKRIWRGLAAGAIAAHAWWFLVVHQHLIWNEVWATLLLAVGSVLEILLGYRLLLQFFERKDLFERAGDTFKFIGIALITSLAGSTFRILILGISGTINTHVLITWLLWVIADMVGILLFTPFILSWFRRFNFEWNRDVAMEVVVFGLTLVSVIILSSIPYFTPIIGKSFPYLAIPFCCRSPAFYWSLYWRYCLPWRVEALL